VLDQLIDLVDDIFIAGEMCLAFVALSERVQLSKHMRMCAEHREVCVALLMKAKLRGCRLILPVDLLQGDEQLQSSHLAKAFVNIPNDARNEGADYDGETKVFSFEVNSPPNDCHFQGSVPAPVTKTIVFDGFVYDIGPESCKLLAQSIAEADLLFVWGTMGVCEVSSFQSGQITLVEAANQLTAHPVRDAASLSPVQSLPMAPQCRDPLRTMVLGDSSVEWFARLADSDGELAGDLVAAGIVTYACRDSVLHAGLLGLCTSNVINGSRKREGELLMM